MKRFEPHSHTHYSNFRLVDSINRPKDLVNRAIELGLCGIAITDHETVAGHMELNLYQEEIQKEYPDFKIALGNEIYLCETRDSGQKYYHFILIAKNKDGQRALRELSTRAWMCSYSDRGMERVVTLYSDLEEIVNKYPNSLIATSACLGGELSGAAVDYAKASKLGDEETKAQKYNHIINFVNWCVDLFGEDFYIEVAPGCSNDQILANNQLASVAKFMNVKMVIGTDAHYLKKEDRYVHKSYLNSKDGDREVDEFYEYSYLQTEEEIQEHLKFSEKLDYDTLVSNSEEIYNKIEIYSLKHNQTIPKVEVKYYPQIEGGKEMAQKHPTLYKMIKSDDAIERYWANECLNKLDELGKLNNTYLNRLEEEADIKMTISEKLQTNMFAYPVTLQHYIDLFWECGSMVGAGRGSSCSGLNHYLLGITQLDPIEWDLPFWRYLNKDRVELGDIDLDICPSKRPLILQKIKEERGQFFNENIDYLSKQNLGCTLIATYGTETTKSAIQAACRGYRSEEYPDGVDVDTAQYLSKLVPIERGFVWSINDVVNGDIDKGRKPVKAFTKELEQYPGLLDIIVSIEGLVNKRSSHASGVILFDEDPYEFGAFMKTPKGELITQYDLHMCEAAGMTKYDFLVTEVQDKLTETVRLLQKYEQIDPALTLKEVYDKYLHPSVLPLEMKKCWKALQNNDVLNVFQFDSDVGSQAAKKIKPNTILEMADANGLMRLMTAEKGEETPMEKYIRFKNDISLWYQEMKDYGLTPAEMEVLKPHFLKSHGVPPSQEQLMTMLMDESICNFTLKEANAARKIVGKKQMSKIPELREKVLNQAASPCLGNYVWRCGLGPQMGYSFSIIHALAYSFIGYQTLFIANNWNPIFWNTACLIVNSASLEEEGVENLREKSSDYAKTAKALGDIISHGIKVSLIDINKSQFSFEPDIESNEILFGLKGLTGVNESAVEEIVSHRPYASFKDFLNRCHLSKTTVISLIKSGAFDKLEEEFGRELRVHPRIAVMAYYLSITSKPKNRLTLQNFNGLLQRDLLPNELGFQKRVFNFNKYLKTRKKGQYYVFDEPCVAFYEEFFNTEELDIINGIVCILQTKWDKMYQSSMDAARDYLKENQVTLLKSLNYNLFREEWDKYATGTLSAWEMEALCFYYNEHELSNVNIDKYGISNFFDMPESPEVDYYFKRNGKEIPIYKTHKIIGTIISKDDTRSSISLLTTEGVVNVKFTKEYYAMFAKQISEKQEDGTKKVMEKGWFQRGTKVMCTGFRRDDMFVTKTYKHTPTHQLYKITEVKNNGDIEIIHDRYGQGE